MLISSLAAKMDPSWLERLQAEFTTPYMGSLERFLQDEKERNAVIYPPAEQIFNVFAMLPFLQVRVVILGQDPYHGEGQAHGLSFSVPPGVKPPPSLRNIFKEIEAEYGMPLPRSGDLSGWVQQGVMLLNATLTVRHAEAGSHQKKGWEQFTDAVIQALNESHPRLVFMLWGSYAQQKGAFIDRKKHLVLEAPHPSPLSAHRGFLGCGHFKKTNDDLLAHGYQPIDWYQLT